MFGRLFWIIFGAGVGLWGRQRAIDTVDQRVPKSVQRTIKTLLFDRIKRFRDEVKDVERRNSLERELADLRKREAERNGPSHLG